jgi:uncharacterized membrane protein
MELAPIATALGESLETVAVALVAIGAAVGAYRLVAAALTRRRASFNGVRLEIARYLALALEFLLAADIVQTTIAPSWTTLGELAVIAAIRTALNLSLSREMREERQSGGRIWPAPARQRS